MFCLEPLKLQIERFSKLLDIVWKQIWQVYMMIFKTQWELELTNKWIVSREQERKMNAKSTSSEKHVILHKK